MKKPLIITICSILFLPIMLNAGLKDEPEQVGCFARLFSSCLGKGSNHMKTQDPFPNDNYALLAGQIITDQPTVVGNVGGSPGRFANVLRVSEWETYFKYGDVVIISNQTANSGCICLNADGDVLMPTSCIVSKIVSPKPCKSI